MLARRKVNALKVSTKVLITEFKFCSLEDTIDAINEFLIIDYKIRFSQYADMCLRVAMVKA